MFTINNQEELTVIHDALIFMLDTEDYTDKESIIITQLLQRCEDNKEI